jgi:hypothetical protein
MMLLESEREMKKEQKIHWQQILIQEILSLWSDIKILDPF